MRTSPVPPARVSDSEVKSLIGSHILPALSDYREPFRTRRRERRRPTSGHSQDFSEAASRGYSLSQDETQEFVTYAQQALRRARKTGPACIDGVAASSCCERHPPSKEQVKQILLKQFMDDKVDQVRQDLGVSFPELGTLSGERTSDHIGRGCASLRARPTSVRSLRVVPMSACARIQGTLPSEMKPQTVISEGSFRLTSVAPLFGQQGFKRRGTRWRLPQ